MGVQNPNSTGYIHSDEPNLLNVHKAMQYNSAGEPILRVATAGGSAQGKLWTMQVAQGLIAGHTIEAESGKTAVNYEILLVAN
jgi:hypothetical protein